MDLDKLSDIQAALLREGVIKGPQAPTQAEQILYTAAPRAAIRAAVQTESLAQVLSAYKVPGAKVQGTLTGPSITTYLVALPPGTRMAALVSGECDLARDLGVTSVRVRESLPGYPGCIGLEVPNSERGTVLFQDTIMTMASKPKDKPYLAVGASSTGMPVALDLTAMPHLLVAGTTRSGKSQFLHGAICSLIRMDAKDLELVLVDPKMVEFTAYAHLPHLREPVATGVDSAGQVLTRLVAEMDRRYTELAAAGMSDIGQYRAAGKQMSYVVAIVDEFGDLMMSGLKHVTCMVETCVIRLAQKGRAAGVHLILSTQNPTVSVISNQIKANMPMRVAFKVTSYTESKVILDQGGAEQLLGEGDMLLSTGERLQGAYLDKQTIVGAVKAAGG